MEKILDAYMQSKVDGLNEKIERVEHLMKRGLITADEAQTRITEFIDLDLPYYDKDHPYNIEEYEEVLDQRRIAYRRMWKFLLEMTEERVRF